MSECILVVDDDREIVRAIAILLEKEGYQVLKAYDGMQALELIAEQKVHLVIMDVMMPKLDGLSAVLKIRERKNIPIIVLSAKSEDTDKVLGLSMGADDYVAKPYNPQELAARVKSHLRRYTSLGDIHKADDDGCITNGRLEFHTNERVLYVDKEPPKNERSKSSKYRKRLLSLRSNGIKSNITKLLPENHLMHSIIRHDGL